MAANFPNMAKIIKLEVEESQETPPPKNKYEKRAGQGVSLLKMGDKGKRFQTARTERTKLPLEEKN